jgi:hypothetical protein
MDTDYRILKTIKLTHLNPIDIIENAVGGAKMVAIIGESTRYSKLNLEELDKICNKKERLCKS